MLEYVHKIKSGAFVIILVIIAFSSGLQAQNVNEGVGYHDLFTKELDIIQASMWDYVKSQAHDYNDIQTAERKRKETIKQVEDSIAIVGKISPFITPDNEDKIYKSAVLKYMNMLIIILKEDYAKIVNMEEIAEQSYDNMEAYLTAKEKASQKFNSVMEELTEKEKEFAKNNNINLIYIDSDITKKLAKANVVYSYYNVIYLIFFKPYKQEMYLLEAANKSDISKIEQNRLTLIKYADEGLKKIKFADAYEKDSSIKDVCLNLMNFYKAEAAEKIIALNEYLLEKDSFEKIKTAFDLKKDTERTKADVDLFNGKVNKLNDAVKKYNKINNEMNAERAELIKTWNDTKNRFIDTHVPK
jgi:hypothetical protein